MGSKGEVGMFNAEPLSLCMQLHHRCVIDAMYAGTACDLRYTHAILSRWNDVFLKRYRHTYASSDSKPTLHDLLPCFPLANYSFQSRGWFS